MASRTVPPVRWAVIGVLSLGMIIAYVSRSALAVPLALPEFIRSFHLSITDRGVLNSAFFWTYAVLQIPAGWVVDRYGVKFPYFLGFDAGRARLRGHVFEHGFDNAHIDGVAKSVVGPAAAGSHVGLDDHPRAGLDLGLQAARRGRPYSMAFHTMSRTRG